MPQQEDKVGALWARTSSKGTKYFSGEINGQKVVVFANGRKDSDKHPDWHVYKSTPQESA